MVKSCTYEVIRTEETEVKYGGLRVVQVRRFKGDDVGGKYQVWEDGKYKRTLPEEEGDLMDQGKNLMSDMLIQMWSIAGTTHSRR